MSRADSIWIDLRTRNQEIFIQENHRPYVAFQDVQSTLRYPQMIMMIGCKVKSQLISNLFAMEAIDGHSKVHMRPIPGIEKDPILIADCELHNLVSYKKAIIKPRLGIIHQRPIRWHNNASQISSPRTLANLVYSKLISPFCTIICFVADDFGGIKNVAKELASWLRCLKNVPTDLPLLSHPRVFVLKRCDNCTSASFDEKLATIEFMCELRKEIEFDRSFLHRTSDTELEHLLGSLFSGIRVLVFPYELSTSSSTREPHILRSRLLQESQDMQKRRRAAKVAFSCEHFKSLFHFALNHFATHISTPFSFIDASRQPNPVPLEIASHITNFIKLVSPSSLISFAVPIVASALCFNSFPPSMHGMCMLHLYNIL